MIHPDDISSLTDFQRNIKKHLARLKKTGRAQILTVNGKATFIVFDPQSYSKLLRRIEQAEEDRSIREAIHDMERGRARPATDFFDELRAELAAKASGKDRQKRRRSA